MNCIVLLLLYMYIVYYRPLNLLDIGLLTIIIISIIIITAAYEPVDTDQEFTLSELEDVLYRWNDAAPGDDTVCYLMINNAPLPETSSSDSSTSHSLRGDCQLKLMENGQDYTDPKERQRIVRSHYFRRFRKSWLVLTRVNWYAQPINLYSLGFRSGVGTIDALATLIYMAAPMTALRRGYKSR